MRNMKRWARGMLDLVLPEPEEKAPAAPSSASPDLTKVHADALVRWTRADEADRDNRRKAYEDLEFIEPGGQWEEEARRQREEEGRPCLEFDRLGTTVAQITGDIRQMRPSVKVVPVDDRGDPKTALVIADLVRYVENRSDASAIYFAAADQQVPAGIGHWEVVTEYASDSTFEQEIAIKPIPDGIGVRWDPDAIDKTRKDAKFCFVPVDMTRDAYDAEYPNKPCSELGAGEETASSFREWSTPDFVRIVKYYVKTPVKKRLALMPDGEVRDLESADPEAVAEAEAMAAAGQARIEMRDGHRIERYLINASEVLEGPVLIPGRFIPVVPVIGVEQVINKKRTRRGVVRKAKDAQKAYNFARSAQTEVIGTQPKAPFMGTAVQFKGYEAIWETANTESHPFLPYNPDPQAPGPPQRVQPPVASSGLTEAAREAAEDIKGVTGIFDASLGAPSNEQSGKAILARQREGDVGSFVYIDNFGRSVRHTGAIIVGMIPAVYDTARTLRIVGEDGKVDLVKVTQPRGLAVDGKPDEVRHDVTVGAYDVSFEMGPSYTTKREAASDGMTAFVQAAPQTAPLVLDLLAKSQDWPMADKIAKRLRSMLPQQVQAEEAQESGEPPPPPPPPSPQEQAAMAQQEREQQLEAARHQLDVAKLSLEHDKLQADVMRARAEVERAQIDAQARVAEASRPPDPQAGAATGPGPVASDPRIDAIAAAVSQLGAIVGMILEELAPPEAPIPEPDGPPLSDGPIPGDMPTTEAPQGALSFDPSDLGNPGAALPG